MGNVYLVLEWVGDAWNEMAIIDENKLSSLELDLKDWLENELDIIVESHESVERDNGCLELRFNSITEGVSKFYVRKFTMNKIGY